MTWCGVGKHGPFEHQVVQTSFDGKLEAIATVTCMACGASDTGVSVDGGIMTAHDEERLDDGK